MIKGRFKRFLSVTLTLVFTIGLILVAWRNKPDAYQAQSENMAYFIMGRSANSRNRVFIEEGEGIRTQAFDPSKMEDPSLIIYAPVRVLGNKTIVTNGDQTDTIYEGMDRQLTFEESLRCREFEPDAPNYTPRISGVVRRENSRFHYALSILKSDNGDPSECLRFTFAYPDPKAGEGHFIHTYMTMTRRFNLTATGSIFRNTLNL